MTSSTEERQVFGVEESRVYPSNFHYEIGRLAFYYVSGPETGPFWTDTNQSLTEAMCLWYRPHYPNKATDLCLRKFRDITNHGCDQS